MYSASGGKVWVPEGTFSWTYTDVATWPPRIVNGQLEGDFKVTAPTVPTAAQLKVAVNHDAWPQDLNLFTSDYR